MSKTVSIVLAGGSKTGFGILTLNRAKASLPFAGNYRLIDFSLSNLTNSGIEQIGIITQYMPSSLIEHVGIGRAWDLLGYGRSIKIMPPFVGLEHTDWYKGTTDAVYKNLNFVDDLDPDFVLIASGEHVYHLDFGRLISFHEERDADLTIVAKRLSSERVNPQLGYLNMGDDQAVSFFKEKPRRKVSNLASVGIYLFKAEVLKNALIENAATGAAYNLARDVIENMVPGEKVFGYEMETYWEYIADAAEYFSVTMDTLNPDSPLKIDQWGVLTNLEDRALGYRPPSLIKPGAEVEESLISPDCVIEGVVKHSVLSPGVTVEAGATVEDSIIMHDCVIRSGAHVRNVIADKDVVFGNGCVVCTDEKKPHHNRELPNSVTNLSLIGKGAIIGKEIEIGTNCQVYPKVNLQMFRGRTFGSGMNIR